jgi:hypothetical protein
MLTRMGLFLFLGILFFVGQVGVDATAVEEFLSGTNGTEEIVAAQRILQALNIHRHLCLPLSLPFLLPSSLSPALHPSLPPCPPLWLSLSLSASLTPGFPPPPQKKDKISFFCCWGFHAVFTPGQEWASHHGIRGEKKNEISSSKILLFPLYGLENN